MSDTQPQRPDEVLDREALSVFLKSDITIEQFPGGHSNLTYLIRTPETEYVLRRPPLGPVAPKAHDMAREYAVLAALHPVFPLAPRPHLLCEDASIIGATFFLMERRQGIVLRHTAPANWNPRATGEAFIDELAQFHSL